MSAPTIDSTSEALCPRPRRGTVRTGDQVQTAAELQQSWESDPRWAGTVRNYTADTSSRCAARSAKRTPSPGAAPSVSGAGSTEDYINALGALTGNQAVEQVKAGLHAIYLSGWQVAADANLSAQTYPDQSLYPANSVPQVVRRINNALMRADQIEASEKAPPPATGWSRSSPTPKPASAARSTRTN